MAKKTANKPTKPIVDVDSLVSEGRRIDMNKVNEIITEAEQKKEEEAKASEEKVKETAEDTNFVQVVEINEEPIEEKKEIVVEDSSASTIEEDKVVDTTEEEDGNIDDVIAECTGEVDGAVDEEPEEDVKPTPKKKEQPWYVARAMRGNDYFSW